MRQSLSDAFILGTHPLREKDRIVSFLPRVASQKRHDPVLLPEGMSAEDEGVREALAHRVIMIGGCPASRVESSGSECSRHGPSSSRPPILGPRVPRMKPWPKAFAA